MSKLFIQCNKDSFCEHIIGGANIYLYGCVSILVPEYAMSLYVCGLCMCVSNQSTAKKTHYMSDVSKLDALLHKTLI